jgi:hypothetical protein
MQPPLLLTAHYSRIPPTGLDRMMPLDSHHCSRKKPYSRLWQRSKKETPATRTFQDALLRYHLLLAIIYRCTTLCSSSNIFFIHLTHWIRISGQWKISYSTGAVSFSELLSRSSMHANARGAASRVPHHHFSAARTLPISRSCSCTTILDRVTQRSFTHLSPGRSTCAHLKVSIYRVNCQFDSIADPATSPLCKFSYQ